MDKNKYFVFIKVTQIHANVKGEQSAILCSELVRMLLAAIAAYKM